MTTPVSRPGYPYSSNSINFSLMGIPDEIQTLILHHLINMNNSHHFIPFLFLTCKKWCHIINRDPCISLVKTLFAIKDKTDVRLSQIPDDVGKSFPEEEFAPQKLKLIDRMYHLYPKSFTILLNYPSALFGENSLYLSLLHRYEWKIEEVENSKNANIRSIACQQLKILISFVKLSLLLQQDKQSLEKNQIEKWHADWQENVNYLENHCHALYPKLHCELIKCYSHYSFAFTAFTEAKIKGFCLNVFKCCGISLEKQLKHFPKDREIVLAAVSQAGYHLKFADASLQSDREIVLATVNVFNHVLQYAADTGLRSDREFMLAAVRKNGRTLKYADESLKNDREIVWDAVIQNGKALKFAAESFKSHRDLVLASVKKDGLALKHAAKNLKNDREIVLNAVSQYKDALEHAAKILKRDREIVLAAIKKNGCALEYADESFQSDLNIVLAAVKQNGRALKFADKCFKSNREIVLAAVSQNGFALIYVAESLQSDREIVLAAVSQNGEILEYAAKSFKSDREIVLAAVSQNGCALKYADESFQSDREIVLAAVSQNGCVLKCADKSLQSDREIVLAAVSQSGIALQSAIESFKSDREIVLTAVSQCGYVLSHAVESLKSDREIVLAAIKNSHESFLFADKKFQNEGFLLEAIQQLFNNLQNNSQLPFSVTQLGKRKRDVLEAKEKEEIMDTATDFFQNEKEDDSYQLTERPNKRLATAEEKQKY